MEKTITFKIGTPRFWKNFTARRNAKKIISKMQYENIEKMLSSQTPSNAQVEQEVKTEAKTQKVEQTETQKVESKAQRMDSVKQQFGNKIIFKLNTKNGNYHADKGVIDGGFIDMARSTKLLVVSELAGKTRVFLNSPTNLRKSQVQKFAEKRGFNVEFE